MTDTAKAIDALHAIPPHLPRDEWVKVGMGAHAAGVDFDTFDAWSAGADNYDAAASRDVWRSIKPGKGVGAGTLYRVAAEHGWRMDGKPQQRAAQAPRKAAEPQRKPAPGMSPAGLWARCEAATAAHGYIVAKAAAGVPLDTLRVVPAGDALRIAGQSMAGCLVVPAFAADGALQSLQLIPPPGAGKKLNLPGAPMAGASFTVGTLVPGAPVGRNTEPGLVVYLAAESPASVRGRLQAYQRHHGVRVPNFAIVQSPIDLFDGDADTEAVIAVVRQLERQRGQKVRLIVGDTLARLSAGANENAGQDMGLVVRRFDRIRSACNAHFLLIHHSGKAAANGARGWSGIRAAVDTEIEVTDSPTGRCAEITKQRDLSTKGERIGFRLDTVTLGTTKWGAAATSCVVVPADAPEKPQGKRVSEVGGAVLEYLRTQPAGKKKREVVEHFQPLYDKSAVYRELKKLVAAGQVLECIGIVTAVSEVRNGAK